ncbi:MAG: STAS domain-containing protein [Variovorax sp.]|jgi:rsbT co-antagonist protein RsbR|nr:MAG: STAS domain-containing protein [Variovorax sp.]
MKTDRGALLEALRGEGAALIQGWLSAARLDDPSVQRSAESEASAILSGFVSGLESGGDPVRLEGPAWQRLRDSLETLSGSRAAKGESAGDTSVFVLAMKKPLFEALQRRLGTDVHALMGAVWDLSTAVDSIAQYTVSTFQRTREDIIRRQQEDLLELSTPVVKLWDGVLAVPMIGVLDSNRTQMVMETLLQTIVETGSELAIIDITGVPTVDTLVAQHLLKTVAAIRLMGADCIISGIRPQIAQTIVHLGIDLREITTKATLADALALALRQTGWQISRKGS